LNSQILDTKPTFFIASANIVPGNKTVATIYRIFPFPEESSQQSFELIGKIEKSKEAIWINVPGVLAQLLNLVTYAVLCNHGERVGLLKRLGYAAAYLAFIVWVGNMPGNVELFKVYCTLAGIAAAGVPWFITVYVVNTPFLLVQTYSLLCLE
jgi:hypothetical protein